MYWVCFCIVIALSQGGRCPVDKAETDIENLADFFKALSHPVRLLILNLLRQQSRHGEELASILSLNPATISHHLALLTKAGLLTSKKDQYYQVFSLNPVALAPTLASLIFRSGSGFSGIVEEDAYRKKVLSTFFQRGRLKGIPAQLKKRRIVLEKIAEDFEPDRQYTEHDVNVILVDYHDDIAALRRGLIEFGFLERQKGIYTRKMTDTQLEPTMGAMK
jgi:ArsR family transcriptional regulator